MRHFRRQDLPDAVRLLEQAGRRCLSVVRVLGPFEKPTVGAVAALLPLNRAGPVSRAGRQKSFACPPSLR